MLIVLDDMIADIESNKKLDPIATELFWRERKLNFSLIFISQSYLNRKTAKILLYHQEMLVVINIWLAKMFYPRKSLKN